MQSDVIKLHINAVILLNFVFGYAVHLHSHQNKHCKWLKKENDGLEVLPTHKYLILEECLYYFLRDKANKDMPSVPSGIQMLPPPQTSGKILTLHFHETVIQKLIVSWQDNRLRWNKNQWKMKTLTIKNVGDIWIPNLTPTRSHQVHERGFTKFQYVKIYSNGTVSGSLQLTVHSQCQVNFQNFPEDHHTCCFHLYESISGSLIHFTFLSQTGVHDPKYSSTQWAAQDITSTVETIQGSGESRIRVCMQIHQYSSTKKIEVTLPMVVCAVLMFMAPAFGNMKQQLGAKLFVILLQYLCFQFLIQRTPQVGFGDETPKIYRFYEFTVGTTLCSLIITLILHGLGQRLHKLPPNHHLTLMAKATNKWLCCCVGTVDGRDSDEQHGNSVSQWTEIYVAINAVLSVLLNIVYVVGIFVICA